MKLFILISLILISSENFADAAKKHRSQPAQTFTLLSCDQLPSSCSDESDKTQSCKTVVKGKTVEESAYDSDNAECMRMRLWKKICAQGTPSEGLKVACH